MTGGADGTNKNPNLWMCVKRTKTVYERRSEWSIRKTNIKLKRSFQQTIQHWKRNPKKTEWMDTLKIILFQFSRELIYFSWWKSSP